MRLHIENMTCAGCVRGVTAAVRAIDPAATIAADLDTRHVQLTTDAPLTSVVAALGDAGFTAVIEGP